MCTNPIRKKILSLNEAYDYYYNYDNNKNYPLEETDPIILNYINSNKHQISMNWWWELEYYLLLHPEIKNIYFLGISWEQCVRTRPLGYEAVFEEAPHLNILTNSKCVLSEVHSDPINIENNVNWKSIGNDIYHYRPYYEVSLMNTDMITSLPSIAILIDCWETTEAYSRAEDCYYNITRFIDATESITAVILATYNCKTERLAPNFVWATNATKLFTNTKRRKIIDLNFAFDTLYEQSSNFKPEQTHPIIWNYENPTKYQISMNWLWQLEYYLSLHPEIKNIYFFGAAWEQCVRYRSLGYESISNEIPNLNILTNSKCVLSTNIHSFNMENEPDWKSLGNDIYLYQPTSLSI
jgi:hypothetical protein